MIARLSRLLSVVLPALAITLLYDSAGRSISPTFYNGPVNEIGGITFDDLGWRYLANLLMIPQWWVIDARGPGSNSPFWSLSYEFAYYIAFAIIVFTRRLWRVISLLGFACIVGPAISILFPLWMAGVAAWRVRPFIGPRLGTLLVGVGLLMVVLFCLLEKHYLEQFDRMLHPALGRHVVTDYFVGIFTLLLITGASGVTPRLQILETANHQRFRQVADHTFELYLVHVPAMFLAIAIVGDHWPLGDLRRTAAVYMVVAVTTIGVARITGPIRTYLRCSARRVLA